MMERCHRQVVKDQTGKPKGNLPLPTSWKGEVIAEFLLNLGNRRT